MPDLEAILRQAMEEDVDAVRIPSDLAGRVRDRHRRHRRGVRVTATVASLAGAMVALPLVIVGVLSPGPSGPAAVADEVDGVELTYLPAGLRRGQTDGWDSSEVVTYPPAAVGETGWTAITGRWYPDDVSAVPPLEYLGVPGAERAGRGLRLTVFRGPDELRLQDVVAYAWRWWDSGEPQDPPLQPPAPDSDGRVRVVADTRGLGLGSGSPLQEGWWRDIYWSPEPGVVLRVGGSADLAGELEAVADGVGRVGPGEQAPGVTGGLCGLESRHWPWRAGGDGQASPDRVTFAGITVEHVPDGLSGSRIPVLNESGVFDRGHGAWMYGYRWIGIPDEGGRGLSVFVICGEAAQDLAGAYEFIHGTEGGDQRGPQPYPRADGKPATILEQPVTGARIVQWLERPGVVIQVNVGEGLVSELDQIVDNIIV